MGNTGKSAKRPDTEKSSLGRVPSRRDSAIAASVTMVFALVLLLVLYFGKIGFSRPDSASVSTPEIASDELFLEPELLDLGEDNSEKEIAAAPAAQGTPEVKPEEKPVASPVVKGENEKPAPPKERRITSNRPSKVKAEESPKTDKEKRKARDLTAGAFSPDNGSVNGRNNSSGSGGTGARISGYADGREFISCPKPSVRLRNRTVIKVRVTVNADGAVTEARAISGADASLKEACRRAALGARWKAKPGSRPVSGTITFTLVPR